MRVALDAGHGSLPGKPHTGASANGLVEDEIALDMIRRIGHHLRKAGHETFCTRPDDKLVSISQRARAACAKGCDLFLSIHCNAGPASARGAEAFVVSGDTRSRKLARELAGAIAKLGLKNRGVKWDIQSQHPRLGVLRGTYEHMPAVLLELGFLTNEYDARMLKDRLFREKSAVEISRCLISG